MQAGLLDCAWVLAVARLLRISCVCGWVHSGRLLQCPVCRVNRVCVGASSHPAACAGHRLRSPSRRPTASGGVLSPTRDNLLCATQVRPLCPRHLRGTRKSENRKKNRSQTKSLLTPDGLVPSCGSTHGCCQTHVPPAPRSWLPDSTKAACPSAVRGLAGTSDTAMRPPPLCPAVDDARGCTAPRPSPQAVVHVRGRDGGWEAGRRCAAGGRAPPPLAKNNAPVSECHEVLFPQLLGGGQGRATTPQGARAVSATWNRGFWWLLFLVVHEDHLFSVIRGWGRYFGDAA